MKNEGWCPIIWGLYKEIREMMGFTFIGDLGQINLKKERETIEDEATGPGFSTRLTCKQVHFTGQITTKNRTRIGCYWTFFRLVLIENG